MWSRALALALWGGPVPPGTATDPSAPTQDIPAARTAVRKAREAAAKGNWIHALEQFERAMQLRPSPKLHYNLAVCHHRIALALKPGANREKREARAIDAYQLYLDHNPEAPDRAEVEANIRALGGDAGSHQGIGRVEGDRPSLGESDYSDLWGPARPGLDEPAAVPPPGPETPASEPHPPPNPQPVPEPPPEVAAANGTGGLPPPPLAPPPSTFPPRARIGGAFSSVVLHPADSLRGDRLDIPVGAGFLIHAAAYLGPRRGLAVGAELGLAAGIPTQLDRHGLLFAHLGIMTDYGWVLGSTRRVEIQLGGLIGMSFESLQERNPPATTVSCPTSDGREVARRGGLMGSLRPAVFVLLGKRRHHMLGLRVAPSMLVMAKGESGEEDRAGDPCDQPDPFAEVGLSAGFGFGLLSDLGYAARF